MYLKKSWHVHGQLIRVCINIDIDFDSMFSMSKK
jgi:hypothetical protein